MLSGFLLSVSALKKYIYSTVDLCFPYLLSYPEGVALPVVVGEPECLLPAQGGRVPLPGCRMQGRGRVRRDVAGRLRDFLHLRVEEGGELNILPGSGGQMMTFDL
jgi:hypothetical protein